MSIKERPKKFKDWEVLALLNNRKTQFREVVRTCADQSVYDIYQFTPDHPYPYNFRRKDGLWSSFETMVELTNEYCPYKVSDHIWGRETWAEITGFVDPCIDAIIDGYFYRDNYLGLGEEPKWRSPVTMPRSASRIMREITDIRIERLQDISEEDCLAEGIKYQGNAFDTISAFAETRKDWDSDPFVWVYHIKKIEND